MKIKNLWHMGRQDIGWLAAKTVTGVIFPVSLFVWAPASVREGTISGLVIYSLLGMMLFGGVLSIAGILVRVLCIKPPIIGYALEIGGIIALISGPLLLGAVYLAHAMRVGIPPTGVIFCMALGFPFIARMMDILATKLAPKAKASPVTTGDSDEAPQEDT